MNHKAEWYIKHKLKPPKAFFDWCFAGIHTYKWSNKTQMIVANEDLISRGCYVVNKRLTKSSNLNFYDKYYARAIILVTSKRIEIQQYGFSSRVTAGCQSIKMELTNFERYADDEIVKLGLWDGKYTEGLVPVFNGMVGPYTRTEFYSNGYRERIEKISELKYLEHNLLYFSELEHLYKYRREIEFLQKIGARQLANDLYQKRDVDMRVITSKWLHKHKQYFKNSDHSFEEFEFEERLRERGGKIVPGIKEYMTYRDIRKIPRGVGMIRFQNWIIKNKIWFPYYLDYLGMLKDLNIDPTGDENLIIPKDLKVAHDNAVELLNILREEERRKEDTERLEREKEQEKKYAENLKSRLKLQQEVDGFAFLLPEKLDDLIIEGKSLHHCVGSSGYIRRHKSGQTTIIFVRQAEDPDTPFFTMEYQNGKIIQLRGKHNQDPPQEVAAAANHWLEEINRKKVRHESNRPVERIAVGV